MIFCSFSTCLLYEPLIRYSFFRVIEHVKPENKPYMCGEYTVWKLWWRCYFVQYSETLLNMRYKRAIITSRIFFFILWTSRTLFVYALTQWKSLICGKLIQKGAYGEKNLRKSHFKKKKFFLLKFIFFQKWLKSSKNTDLWYFDQFFKKIFFSSHHHVFIHNYFLQTFYRFFTNSGKILTYISTLLLSGTFPLAYHPWQKVS